MNTVTYRRTYITKDGLFMSEDADIRDFASVVRRYFIPRHKAVYCTKETPVESVFIDISNTGYREYRFDGIEDQEDKSLINALYFEV